jgi:cytochrome c oxidase cbb3-type subunit III
MRGRYLVMTAVALTYGLIVSAQEQTGVQNSAGQSQNPAGGRGRRGGMGGFTQRPQADPATLERGKGLYSVNCAFCHGSDARGGEGGPNLLRSTIVLSDSKGESIAPILRDGRPSAGMPAFPLAPPQVADIAAYLHSFPVGGRDAAGSAPATIVVGDAAAGQKFFQAKCGACHSAAGDLKGLAARIKDPKTLQQTWLMPGGRGGRGAPVVAAPPIAATVTLASGEKIEGRLERMDDFVVTVRDHDGAIRAFPRSGSTKVELRNPLQPHMDLLGVYTDKDIHDVTAYLVTLK